MTWQSQVIYMLLDRKVVQRGKWWAVSQSSRRRRLNVMLNDFDGDEQSQIRYVVWDPAGRRV